jgi:chromosome condensin MukBEF ATPase and DNA-binding subunit MukB
MNSTAQQPSTPNKRTKNLIDDTLSFFDLDKSTIGLVGITSISIFISIYLYRELRQMKEEVKLIKGHSSIPDDIIEQIQHNTNSINAITTKLDQLIKFSNQQQLNQQQLNQQQLNQQQLNQQQLNQQQLNQQLHQQQLNQQQLQQLHQQQQCSQGACSLEEIKEEDGEEDEEEEEEIPVMNGSVYPPNVIRI